MKEVITHFAHEVGAIALAAIVAFAIMAVFGTLYFAGFALGALLVAQGGSVNVGVALGVVWAFIVHGALCYSRTI